MPYRPFGTYEWVRARERATMDALANAPSAHGFSMPDNELLQAIDEETSGRRAASPPSQARPPPAPAPARPPLLEGPPVPLPLDPTDLQPLNLFLRDHPPAVTQTVHGRAGKVYIMPPDERTGDARVYIVPAGTERIANAEAIMSAGVRFPGIGWDSVKQAFITHVEDEDDIRRVAHWARFLIKTVSGEPADPPAGIQFGEPQTYRERFAHEERFIPT
jgi:hypothetical protein